MCSLSLSIAYFTISNNNNNNLNFTLERETPFLFLINEIWIAYFESDTGLFFVG